MTIPSTLREAAIWYVSHNLAVVPLAPDSKIPILKRFTRYPFTDPDAVADYWDKRPNCHIGIVAGYSGLVCVDCDGEQGLAAFLGLVDNHGGEIGEPWIASTASGGKHFVYRHPGTSVKSRGKRHNVPIDVKADGGQFAVFPSAGKLWEYFEPGLPGTMPQWLLEWVVADDTPAEKASKSRKTAKAPREYAGPTIADGDKLSVFLSRLENVRQRGDNHWMACCPAHVSVGRNSLSVMAGQEQPVVAHCFAGCDPVEIFRAVNLDFHDVCSTMPEQFRDDILPGVESLSAKLLDGESGGESIDEIAGDDLDAGTIGEDLLGPGEMPDLAIGGMIDAVREWNHRTSMSWQPELAMAGAIALMATISGRKVRDQQNTRTNVYLVGIAPSGAGKEHGRKLNRIALSDAGCDEFLSPSDIASGAGLAALLDEHPCRLAQIDEIGDLLASIRASGAKARHLATIETYLKEIYSSSDSTWMTGGYADTSKNKVIRCPHLVIYGTGSPEKFWESITPANIGDGVLPRLMIFDGSYVRYQETERLDCCPPAIAKVIQAWANWNPTDGGNLGQTRPVIVPFDSSAQKRLKEHQFEIAEKRVKEDPLRAAVWSRTAEKSFKLALIFACSRVADPSSGDLLVTLVDADNAIRLSNWLTRKMIFQVWGKVGRNERERNAKKIIEIVNQFSPIAMHDLTKRTRWLTKRDRQELLSELAEIGEVVIMDSGTSHRGRPGKIIQSAR